MTNTVDDSQLETAGAGSAFAQHYAVRGCYQRADTSLTLEEGLAEYYRVNPGLSNPAEIEEEKSARYFHNHDCTHVVFGTHTGPLDEGVNDLFTLFGVDVRYVDYISGFLATQESKAIIKAYSGPSFGLTVRSLLRTVRLLPKVRRTCRSMHKKWPWDPAADLMDRPLRDVREEFGIHVWRPELELGLTEGSR